MTEDICVIAVFGETEKDRIKLHYKKPYDFKVDNCEIFRSIKKKISFGETRFL